MDNGTETVLNAGPGSVINAGHGHDTFDLSKNTLIVGATADDDVRIGGEVLHGGIGWQGSQSGWAVGTDGTQYTMDTAGELVIKDKNNDEEFVANYKGGPGFSTDTAGIYIATGSALRLPHHRSGVAVELAAGPVCIR